MEIKRLHDASCTGCHDSSFYTRQDHHVRSLEELKQQVENCTPMAQKEFSPAERQDIVKHLNDQFYRFQWGRRAEPGSRYRTIDALYEA